MSKLMIAYEQMKRSVEVKTELIAMLEQVPKSIQDVPRDKVAPKSMSENAKADAAEAESHRAVDDGHNKEQVLAADTPPVTETQEQDRTMAEALAAGACSPKSPVPEESENDKKEIDKRNG